MHGHVLGRILPKKEKRKPELSRILFCRSAAHSLYARIVADMLTVLKHFAAFDLPAHGGVIDVVQAFPLQGVSQTRRRRSPEDQLKRFRQSAAAVRDEEVHKSSGRVIEAHNIG